MRFEVTDAGELLLIAFEGVPHASGLDYIRVECVETWLRASLGDYRDCVGFDANAPRPLLGGKAPDGVMTPIYPPAGEAIPRPRFIYELGVDQSFASVYRTICG